MVNPGGNADTGKIQHDEEEILKEIIKEVKKFIEEITNALAQNIGKKKSSKKLSNRLSIIINGRTVFQSNLNQEANLSSISSENLQRINKAIKDPQNSSDNLKIRLGKQTLFEIKDQKVLVDKLNLSKAPKQEQKLSLEQKVEQLTKLVTQQQERIDQLEKKIEQKLDFISKNTSQLQNKKLGSWMGNVGNKLSGALSNLGSKIKNFIDSNIQNVAEKVTEKSAKFLEKPVNFVLDKYGLEEKPGILSFEGQQYSYSKNLKNGEFSIRSNETQNNIVEKGNFTQKASPDDIKILKDLPEKVKSIANAQAQTQKRGRGISR